MPKTVKVTRKGQTTIIAKIRKKHGIKEGDNLTVEAKDSKIIFKPIPRLEDMCGIFVGKASVAELKKEIEKCVRNIELKAK
jgi:AbrB family looped-hinge helix DNA binding protein